MKRTSRRIRVNKTYKRFIFSFLLVLCLPVVCFTFIFMQNYREIYRDKIIEQAETSLKAAGMELNRDVEGLQRIVSYNATVQDMSKHAILQDYSGEKIRKVLNRELGAHSILENICYYNEIKPDIVYTGNGTYTASYYARLCAGMNSGEEFLRQLQDMDKSVWIRRDGRPETGESSSLQYIIKTNLGTRWIFTIDEENLKQIIAAEDSVTTLWEQEGGMLYSTDQIVGENYFEIRFVSPNGYFELVRYIDGNRLFSELNVWQRNFFLIVILVMLVGGMLVLVLTYYNEYPIRELLLYCRGMVQNIPVDMGGLEAFQFAMKSLEEKAVLSEDKRRRNRLLLHLIYGRDCDTEYFRNAMKEEGLFERAECYRVVLEVFISGYETGINKLGLYLDMAEKGEYEFRLIDIPNRDAAVMIVGMTDAADEKLEEELLQIAETVEENTNEENCFYVGGKVKELKKLHLSYSQAFSCSQNGGMGRGRVVYYEPVKQRSRKFQYPNGELDDLYNSLIRVEQETASAITDRLIEILKEQSDNRFTSVSLYYDILNTYYRAQTKLEVDAEYEFLETDLLEVKDPIDAIQMIIRIQEQYQAYIGGLKGKHGNKAPKDEGVDKEDFILEVLAFIDENSRSGELSVSMVADHFGISISHMSHKFKGQMNRTILEYITEKKFAYACELLLETDYNVKDIAVMTGYSHPVSFIRKFKQQYGMTPVEYRMKKQM